MKYKKEKQKFNSPVDLKAEDIDTSMGSSIESFHSLTGVAMKEKPDVEDSNSMFFPSTSALLQPVKTEVEEGNLEQLTDEVEVEEEKDSQPDPYDSNNYCRSCQHTYYDRRGYLRHLRVTHNIRIGTPIGRPNPQILPDENDPNNYCRSCDHTYTQKCHYIRHLQNVHNIRTPSHKSSNSDKYCKVCDREFSRPSKYRSHLSTQSHKNNLRDKANPTNSSHLNISRSEPY